MAERSALEVLVEDEELFWAVFEQRQAQAQRELPDPSGPGARWSVGGRKVGAHALFKAVFARGGYQVAVEDKATWWAVAQDVGIPPGLAGTLSYPVRQLYESRFLDLEVAMLGEPAASVAGADRSLRARKPATPKQTRGSSNTPSSAPSQPPHLAPPPPPPTSSSSSSYHPAPPSHYQTSPHPTTETMAGNQQEPMYTIVVDTPGNRRGVYSMQPEDSSTYPSNVEPALAAMIPEKTPRIYHHCVMGLQSDVEREVDFALHHLVIISDERGDKFRFKDFPYLVEALVRNIICITEVVYSTTFSYNDNYPDPENPGAFNVLYTAVGTQDLLDRIAQLRVTISPDDLEDNHLGNKLRLIKEASLVLRNMCMLEDNAKYLDDIEVVRDVATIVLNLPEMGGRFMEIRNNMLELVEQTCPYWPIWETDPLYRTLVQYIHSNDRFHILTALRSLTMFALDSEDEGEKKLVNIPLPTIDTLMRLYLLVQDPELLSAILDFFYQYTAVPENVIALRDHVHLPTTVIERMTNLLTYDSEEHEVVYTDETERRAPAPKKIQMPPPDLYVKLLQFAEPERTARWLKCCFVEDEECEVTQLALWHAYQNCFSEIRGPGVHNLGTLQATDFISTVTSTFPPAEAKIVEGPSAKFIIKGIRPLEKFYNLEGYPYHMCEWQLGPPTEGVCNHYYLDPVALRNHVYRDHIALHSSAPGGFNLADQSRAVCCFWDDCNKFRMPTRNVAAVAGHINLHLPAPYNMSQPPPVPERPIIKPARSRVFEYYSTPVDDKGEPYGIAYKALLIMRNIQRNLSTGSAGAEYSNMSWPRAIFLSHRSLLIEIADLNPSLRGEIFDLVAAIDRS